MPSESMQFTLQESRLGLLNSVTRIPFRYGSACLTRCPQAVLRVDIETPDGLQAGYSADCLPPSWFDKSPGKNYQTQIDDMLAAIAIGEEAFGAALSKPSNFFTAWFESYQQAHERCAALGFNGLLASFGHSLVERAVLDGICRAQKVSFATALHTNVLGIEAGAIHPDLAGLAPHDWLPPEPRTSIFVRHTVGLTDPLTAASLDSSEVLQDGLPQTLEEYIRNCGLRYFKIKVSNQLDHDLDRLQHIAELVEKQRGDDYQVTIDGNEQYEDAEEFGTLVDAIRRRPALATLWRNTIVVEQPLARGIALDEAHTHGIRELSKQKCVIIDESDAELHAFSRAIKLGYGGVSSKSCKGPTKSVLNAGLIQQHNRQSRDTPLQITAEDLCTVGLVALQADLCLVAALGIEHVERNGHHYHRGLSYLGDEVGQAALAAHGDLYCQIQGTVVPRLADGRFQIASLQCPGFGFRVEPDLSLMQDRSQWSFASLGL